MFYLHHRAYFSFFRIGRLLGNLVDINRRRLNDWNRRFRLYLGRRWCWWNVVGFCTVVLVYIVTCFEQLIGHDATAGPHNKQNYLRIEESDNVFQYGLKLRERTFTEKGLPEPWTVTHITIMLANYFFLAKIAQHISLTFGHRLRVDIFFSWSQGSKGLITFLFFKILI